MKDTNENYIQNGIEISDIYYNKEEYRNLNRIKTKMREISWFV